MKLFILSLLLGLSCQPSFSSELDISRLFAKAPTHPFVKISPDGRYLATAVSDDHLDRLLFVNLSDKTTRKQDIQGFGNVLGFEWIDGSQAIVVAEDTMNVAQVLLLNMESHGNKILLKGKNGPEDRYASIDILRFGNQPELVVVKAFQNGGKTFYRFIKDTSELVEWRSFDHSNSAILPGSTTSQILVEEWNKVSYSIYLSTDTGTETKKVRKNLFSGELTKFDGVNAFALNEDGTRIIATHSENGRNSLKSYDIASERFVETYISDPIYDIDPTLIYLPFDNSPAAAVFNTDKRRIHYFHKTLRTKMSAFDILFPDKINVPVSATNSMSIVIVLSSSDKDPGTYYLYDIDNKKIEPLFSRMEWLDAVELQAMKAISYPARDGRLIHGYLTLPKDGKAAPLIVLVHGGPHTRVTNKFDPLVQFLAASGYAVLSPNYRGSTGYGQDHFLAGLGEVGLKVQKDLYDAVTWAQSLGFGTDNRVCFVGGSYGGYASAKALFDLPGNFRCGVSIAGFYDVKKLLVQDSRKSFYPIMEMIYGSLEKDGEKLNSISITSDVGRLRDPLLIVHGVRDERVDVSQAVELIDLMKSSSTPYFSLIKLSEGHSFSKTSAIRELYFILDLFLERNLSPISNSKLDTAGGIDKRLSSLNADSDAVIARLTDSEHKKRKSNKDCSAETGSRIKRCQ